MYNMSNLKTDKIQLQKITLGSSSLRDEEKAEAAVGIQTAQLKTGKQMVESEFVATA